MIELKGPYSHHHDNLQIKYEKRVEEAEEKLQKTHSRRGFLLGAAGVAMFGFGARRLPIEGCSQDALLREEAKLAGGTEIAERDGNLDPAESLYIQEQEKKMSEEKTIYEACTEEYDRDTLVGISTLFIGALGGLRSMIDLGEWWLARQKKIRAETRLSNHKEVEEMISSHATSPQTE